MKERLRSLLATVTRDDVRRWDLDEHGDWHLMGTVDVQAKLLSSKREGVA